MAAIALTDERLLYGTFELASEGCFNRYDVADIMSGVVARPVRAEKSSLQQAQISEQLNHMMTWYNTHSLLSNPTTLRAILGREPNILRAFLEELEQ